MTPVERKRDARELTRLIGAALLGGANALMARTELMTLATTSWATGTAVTAALEAATPSQRAALLRQAVGEPLTAAQRVALYRFRSRPAFRVLLARASTN